MHFSLPLDQPILIAMFQMPSHLRIEGCSCRCVKQYDRVHLHQQKCCEAFAVRLGLGASVVLDARSLAQSERYVRMPRHIALQSVTIHSHLPHCLGVDLLEQPGIDVGQLAQIPHLRGQIPVTTCILTLRRPQCPAKPHPHTRSFQVSSALPSPRSYENEQST